MAVAASIADLPTPALVLDRARFAANVARMERRARDLGVDLRPHLKTAKSIDVARAIPSATRHGITVSTVKEARYFVEHGIRDVLYAVTVTPDRLARLAPLRRAGAEVRLAVDCELVAAAVTESAARERVTFEVLIEIDCGEHRSGIPPDAPELVPLAAALDTGPATRLGGVFTHAGHSYDERSVDAIRAIAEQERAAVVHARDRLAEAGLPCPIVSVGSTPTATHAAHLDGVTELRAGVYVFQDAYQAAIGSCEIAHVAASVLTTVIGHQRRHGRVLIDAGGLALSKDHGTANLGAEHDCGYGLVMRDDGETLLDGVRVVAAFQEHGVLEGRDGLDFDSMPIGTRLRILPNHACMTAAAYDRYHVITSGRDARIDAVWPRIHEWV